MSHFYHTHRVYNLPKEEKILHASYLDSDTLLQVQFDNTAPRYFNLIIVTSVVLFLEVPFFKVNKIIF